MLRREQELKEITELNFKWHSLNRNLSRVIEAIENRIFTTNISDLIYVKLLIKLRKDVILKHEFLFLLRPFSGARVVQNKVYCDVVLIYLNRIEGILDIYNLDVDIEL